MASRRVEVVVAQLKERLIAAVESNDVDATRDCIQAGGDPITDCVIGNVASATEESLPISDR